MITRILTTKMGEIAVNLNFLKDKIAVAVAKRPQEFHYFQPRLVAVGKTKPPALLIAAYELGQRNFGENYVNELVDKANNPDILKKCKDIHWHFIGHLQRNKVNKVLGIPNLYLIETIDSEKLASAVNNSWEKLRKDKDKKLNVMIQVNTSKEEEKQGCDIEETPTLVKHVLENCKNLTFVGLMTIGAYGYDIANGPNPDFIRLKKCREDVCNLLGLETKNVELSMGMSSDYEHAKIFDVQEVKDSGEAQVTCEMVLQLSKSADLLSVLDRTIIYASSAPNNDIRIFSSTRLKDEK